jgi:hypothetical protein
LAATVARTSGQYLVAPVIEPARADRPGQLCLVGHAKAGKGGLLGGGVGRAHSPSPKFRASGLGDLCR